MFSFLNRFFSQAAQKDTFVSIEAIQKANERLKLRNPTNLGTLWPSSIPKPTRSDIEAAGRKAMQAHFAREAAAGGPWWQRDPVFQKQLKTLRGEPHLSLVKNPDGPNNP